MTIENSETLAMIASEDSSRLRCQRSVGDSQCRHRSPGPLIGVAAITLAAKIVSADVRRARHIRSAFGRGRSERPINAIDPAPGIGHHRVCVHLSVIDKAASRAPERQVLKAITNGDNALEGRTRSAFWAAGRPTRSS